MLQQKIDDEMKTALKSGASGRLNVLRLLSASLKNEKIKQGADLTEDQALKVLQREAKQRRDSIEAYKQGNRNDLAESEAIELKIIEEFLPAQMSESELIQVVDEVLSGFNNPSMAQMGVIIGEVVKRAGGGADGATVAELVRQKLS